jgi:hypothetical protein
MVHYFNNFTLTPITLNYPEANRSGLSDPDQLSYAVSQKRAILTISVIF